MDIGIGKHEHRMEPRGGCQLQLPVQADGQLPVVLKPLIRTSRFIYILPGLTHNPGIRGNGAALHKPGGMGVAGDIAVMEGADLAPLDNKEFVREK